MGKENAGRIKASLGQWNTNNCDFFLFSFCVCDFSSAVTCSRVRFSSVIQVHTVNYRIKHHRVKMNNDGVAVRRCVLTWFIPLTLQQTITILKTIHWTCLYIIFIWILLHLKFVTYAIAAVNSLSLTSLSLLSLLKLNINLNHVLQTLHSIMSINVWNDDVVH